MRWTDKSDPELVKAIVASFRDSPEHSRQRLSSFSAKEWTRTAFWLDTSGLALYFLDHLRANGIIDAVDPDTRDKLEQKLADNKLRLADMLQEFAEINRSFQSSGICYANLKGFTLSPHSCPDLSLRYQSDYDFLVDPDHLKLARALLEKKGYVVTGRTSRTLEMKIADGQRISLDGQYKSSARRSVELHVALEGFGTIGPQVRDQRLNRLSEWRHDGQMFPALSPADQLIGQALHLLGHMRNEHTRPSWLLEYSRHVLTRREEEIWKDVRTLAEPNPDAVIALGLSTLLTTYLFGAPAIPELDSWTADVLPAEVKIWAAQYGRKSVLSKVPGTKLYLLLDDALTGSCPHLQSNRMRRLIPLRRPPHIMQTPLSDTFYLRIQREIAQLRFIFFRLRFHLKQGVIFAVEQRRWRKLLKQHRRDLHAAGTTQATSGFTVTQDNRTKTLR